MAPAFRVELIVRSINRYLGVFGHNIRCLETSNGKELGNRGSRRWRPGTGTGSRFGFCVHCKRKIEVFLFGSIDEHRYMVFHRLILDNAMPHHSPMNRLYFYLTETANGFVLEGLESRLREDRMIHADVLVCPRVLVFL